MGNFFKYVEMTINWMSNIFHRVLIWFRGDIQTDVEQKTTNFVKDKEDVIKTADDPHEFGKVVAVQKGLIEVNKYVDGQKRKLTPGDKNKLDDLFAGEVGYS